MIDHAAIASDAYHHHHASQRLDELTEAVRLAATVDPLKVAVEIGCDAGGTLYCWRQLCDEVYGITLPDNSWPEGGTDYPLVTHGATVLIGDSRRHTSALWLAEKLAGRPVDLLHIDGDHSYAGVDQDYDTYASLVRPGGLVLINDVRNLIDRRVQVPRWWDEHFPKAPIIASRAHRPAGFGVVWIGAAP